MARPCKRRLVSLPPVPAVYKPAGVALDGLQEILLRPEELEALRLAHLEDLPQAEAAERMGVSRSTFQRILEHAHRQVTLALVGGQALRLEDVQVERRPAGGGRRRQSRPAGG